MKESVADIKKNTVFVSQVCENQRNDLQLLQLNLDCARESLKEKTSQGSLGR